jgi:hypothetical protein
MNTCYNFYYHDGELRISKRSDDSVVVIDCGEQFIFSKSEIVEILTEDSLPYPTTEKGWENVCRILAFDCCG